MLRVSTHSVSWQPWKHVLLFAVLLLITVVSCREKDDTTGPEPPPGGSWRIVLEDVATLYVPNDTINVRLYAPDDSVAVGKLLRFSCDVDTGRVTQFATTTNPNGQYPWGCNPALIYWGDGSDDQEDPYETIRAYYINLQSPYDTLADTSRTYRVAPRP